MKSLILILLFFSFVTPTQAQLTPTKLRCEYLVNPSVIDVGAPSLSWVKIAKPNERGQTQTAWEIMVATSKEKLVKGEADLWSSGKVTGQTINIEYKGKVLSSRQDCWW